jgi:ribonuclease G
VTEVARQIRLRDLGGIIVVDFIDMTVPEHRNEVVRKLEEELRNDRTRSHISQISEFGLIEITRKRARGGLRQRLTDPCPCCSGRGRIKSSLTIALELRRTARRRRFEWAGRTLSLRTHPRVAAALGEEQQAIVREIEALLQTKIRIVSDPTLLPDEYEIRGE